MAALVTSAAIALFALGAWLRLGLAQDLQVSLPGGDGRPASMGDGTGAVESLDLRGSFERFDGAAAALPGTWPRFRGADFDNISKEDTPLADAWPPEGPEVLWTVALGEGYAAPVVWEGRVFLIDYDEENRRDAIRCFSLGDGKEIWRHSYPVAIKRNHGMSRTVPAVTEDYLVTIGPRCHVVCLDPTSGDYRWGIDLQNDYGATEPLWYTGQCPLIENGLVILAPGGPEALLIAVDCATGEVKWSTPNPNGWIMSHSSIMPMTFAGRKMYVYASLNGIVGVVAEGVEAGKLLWEFPWNPRVAAPSPLPLPDGKIFLTAGYGYGSLMLQLREGNGGIVAEEVFRKEPKDGLACEQQTPVYYDGLLYGIMPKDAGALRCEFVCYRPDGALVWSSGPDRRFGLGPFLLADGKFYILSDEGELSMIRVSSEAYEELGQAKIFDGQDAWGPIALAHGRMLLRDSKDLYCINVGASAQETVSP